LESLARSYKAETDKTAIRVNIVDPGRVRTKMRAEAFPGEDPQTLPPPEDIVNIFIELANPGNSRHGERVKL
jgi:NAD(P)-dependent dehydrogenase (short-subunit alcohol dehydrogenase family)